jgi:SET domain-containing protein
MIMRGETKYIRIGDSNVCGLGAFAGEDINKDDLVIVYTGEVTEFQIDYMREGLKLDDTFYNFSYSEGGSAIDARYIGNKARFINHSQDGAENLEASTMFSEGRFLTVLCAKKSIKKGEELFFDYDLTGEISRNFPGKYPFIKPKKKKTTFE